MSCKNSRAWTTSVEHLPRTPDQQPSHSHSLKKHRTFFSTVIRHRTVPSSHICDASECSRFTVVVADTFSNNAWENQLRGLRCTSNHRHCSVPTGWSEHGNAIVSWKSSFHAVLLELYWFVSHCWCCCFELTKKSSWCPTPRLVWGMRGSVVHYTQSCFWYGMALIYYAVLLDRASVCVQNLEIIVLTNRNNTVHILHYMSHIYCS